MYWLIETNEQLNNFKEQQWEEAYVEIIPFNFNVHPTISNVSLIYIRPLESHKGYIISIMHSESFSLSIDTIIPLLEQFTKIYTRDKKEFLHYFPLNNLWDINLNYPPIEPQITTTHDFFYRQYQTLENINLIIPIVKHFEYCETLFNLLKNKINEPINDFYNHKAPLVFNAIERNGIQIHKDKFSTYFYNTTTDRIHTKYNYRTLTRRPSNTTNGINFNSLNKKTGERDCIIPSNSYFVEIDIHAYHPVLLSKLVGYTFEEENVYSSLSKIYGSTIEEAKELTFKQIYGGIYPQYKDFTFFKKVQTLTDNLWSTFNKTGNVEGIISKYKFNKEQITDINPQKLLNYVLQELETSNNINLLWDIIKILRNKKTKLILYVFDSFLLDVAEDEDEVLSLIYNVFKNNNLNIKIKKGTDYQNLYF
jgi:hypothetical protein